MVVGAGTDEVLNECFVGDQPDDKLGTVLCNFVIITHSK